MNLPLTLMHGVLRLFETRDQDVPLSRAQFLRGRGKVSPLPLRPPWAVPEPEFSARCSGCGICRQACPEQIIVEGDDSLPAVNFGAGGCTFCGDCLRACPEGALSRDEGREAPWQLTVTITPACLAASRTVCRSCGEACPVGAIAFTPRPGRLTAPVLIRDQCTGCGACVGGCPAGAIVVAAAVSSHQPRIPEVQA
jgi:ferredoxin-type protein NapF